MAIPIFKNEIEKLANKEAEKDLKKWLQNNLQEIEQLKLNITQREKYILRELKHNVDQIHSTLLLLIQTSSKPEAVSIITKLNRLLPDLQKFEQSLTSNRKVADRDLKMNCEELGELLKEYQVELNPEAVYQRFLELPGVKVNFPGFGPTVLKPQEVEKRFDVLAYIKEVIEKINQTPIKDELYNKCFDITLPPLPEYKTELQGLAVSAIENISELNLQASAQITKFTKLLKDILQLELDIEIGAPETSQDAILAEIIQICQNPQNRERLVVLGRQLGYSRDVIDKLSDTELCRTLQHHFNL